MKKKILIACVAAKAALAFAGSAAADGTDFVVSADPGETYTYSTAVGSYTRLVKRGAGEVVLTAASSGFSGSVVVEAGTLTIKNKSAVGKSAVPIEVKDGATLHLYLPGATQFGHDITIAGNGVNDAGAFKYTKDGGSGNSDSLINSLTLSADATIDVSARWGMSNDKIIDLNGHTLTRIGGENWMIYNHIQSTGAPGEVNNVNGTLTMQGTPDIDENVTVVVTNVDTSCFIGLWGVTSSDTIKGKIKLYSGRNITAQSGTTKDRNHIGPLHLAGPSRGSATLTSEHSNNARMMSVDGAVTSDSGMGLAVSGKGDVWFNNDVTVLGDTYVQGNGNLHLCGEESVRDMKWALRGSSTTIHEAGRTYLRMLRVANGGSEKAQLRQTGGVIAVGSGDNGRIGEGPGHRAYYTLEGGEMHVSNTTYVAEKAGSFGAFRQTGGLFELRRSGSGDRFFYVGAAGNALFVQTGGTNDTLIVNDTQVSGFQMATNGMSEATISGVGALLRTGGISMGATGSVCTNIFNVSDGAIVKANRLRKNPNTSAGTRAYVNVNGGILMPTFAWGWTVNDKSYPDHFVVWEDGITVDTSENATGGGAGASSFEFALEKPTGKGVERITLPADVASQSYIGIGRIVIEDETGWGASAYVEFDFTTKTLTNVVVTSRGCNYSENAKAYLESPAGTTRYECGITLSDNAGRCGMLVKSGAPTLEITSANSTIDGGYAVEGGALKLGVVPGSAVPVRVASGATLNLNNKGTLTASTFEGAGSVINGNVTVTGAIKMTCADIFTGHAATFGGDLTIANGAVFEITDAENLVGYKNAGHVVVLTAGGTIEHVPSVRFRKSDGTQASVNGSWSLRLSADGKSLRFGYDKGFVISVR